MGSIVDSIPASSNFDVLDDPRPGDTSLPAFMVSKTRGFLPRSDPVVELPPAFAALESLLTRMPVRRLDGKPGLLAEGKLGDAVHAELPDLTDAVASDPAVRDNLPLLNALYRDYAFLASAYMLEPCHLRFLRGEPYGLGRTVLPANIARPIAQCAEMTGFKPFMEYAGSYALFNYRLADPKAGLVYDNLRLIRAFEHGLDPTSSEAGFVLVHVDMVRNSGPLVAGTCACLDAADAAAQGGDAAASRAEFDAGLTEVRDAMQRINDVMETMWAKSRPEQYTSFRTFIFGITSQSMFPEGVVYEGVDAKGHVLPMAAPGTSYPQAAPLSFRGESGANDSMVPLMDNFLQVPMPNTPLTAILMDFRQYRPSNHRAFLAYVRERAHALDIRAYALREATSAQLWLQVLDQVRAFRWRHWCFGKEYILKRTTHPTATGGSPIVTWLPNQLQAILREMQEVHKVTGTTTGPLGPVVVDIMDVVERQTVTLAKEVARYCEERGM